jgi:uncharacterized protein YdaU (DUF1376 family)
MEDLAYMRLLQQYYLREGPLPADIQATAKLVRMRSMASDVESVLNEFFHLTEAGWMHTRCETEIAKMQDKQEKARASGIASANARKTYVERAAKAKPTNVEEKPTNVQRPLGESATDVQLPTPTPTPTPTLKNTSAVAPPEGVTASVWADFCQLRKDKKAKLTQTAVDGIAAEAGKAGWALDAALRECCARGWVGFKAEWVLPDKQKQQAETFKERDARLGREKWERMTGEQHPDHLPAGPIRSILDVVDIEIKTLGMTQ